MVSNISIEKGANISPIQILKQNLAVKTDEDPLRGLFAASFRFFCRNLNQREAVNQIMKSPFILAVMNPGQAEGGRINQ